MTDNTIEKKMIVYNDDEIIFTYKYNSLKSAPTFTLDKISTSINLNADIKSANNGTLMNDNGILSLGSHKTPSSNIMQSDYTGSTNIFSPYLYYDKGKATLEFKRSMDDADVLAPT